MLCYPAGTLSNFRGTRCGHNRPNGNVWFHTGLARADHLGACHQYERVATIWVFQKTGSATALGLMQVFFITPLLIITPFAGVLVDRHNRKLMMMVSDLTAGLATISILILQALGVLGLASLHSGHLPGVGKCVSMACLFRRHQHDDPQGKIWACERHDVAGRHGARCLAPMLAGSTYCRFNWYFVAGCDDIPTGNFDPVFCSYPAADPHQGRCRGTGRLKEAVFGFRHIFARPSPVGAAACLLLWKSVFRDRAHCRRSMILLRTGNDSVSLGLVQSAGAIGGAGMHMSAWGGFKRKVHGVLGGWIICSFFFALMGLGTWVPSASYQCVIRAVCAVDQRLESGDLADEGAPDVQGRVFSARTLIAWLTNPISPLIAGTLSDYVLEPAMREPRGACLRFGWLITPGPGAGAGLLIFFSCFGGILAGWLDTLSAPSATRKTSCLIMIDGDRLKPPDFSPELLYNPD